MSTATRDNLTLAACALCGALAMGVFLLFPIWAPSWMTAFGSGRSAVMLIYSASGIVMTLSMPVAGWLVTRFAAWKVIVAGAVILGGGAIASSTVHTLVAFAIVYSAFVGTGAAIAGILPCQSLAIRLFPRHVGKISGLMMVALATAGMVLPLVVTPFMQAAGWRTALAVSGASILVIIPLLAVLFMRERAPVETADAAEHSSSAEAPTGNIVRTAAFWIILAGIFPMQAASTAIQANLLPIAADHGVGLRDASFMLSGLAAGTIAGAILFGWLVDRIDPRLVVGGAAGLMAASLIAFAGHGGLAVAASATVVLGFAGGSIMPLLSTFAHRYYRATYAPAYGLLSSFMLPYMFAPPLVGLVRDKTGSYADAFFGAIPVLLLSGGVVWLLRSTATAGVSNQLAQPAE